MRTPLRPALNRRLHQAGFTSATVVATALVLSLFVGQVPAGAAPGPAAPAAGSGAPGVSDVRIGLIRLASALAAAAQQPALSEDLPLTDTSVRDVLSLDTAIGTVVDTTLEAAPSTTLDTLDDAFATGAVVVREVASPDGAPTNSRDWTMSLDLDATRSVALAYPDDRLRFGTAALGGDLLANLRGTIRFRYDPDEIALRRFAVVGSSKLTAHAWTDQPKTPARDIGEEVSIPDFKVVDGFVELDSVGTAKIDTTTVLDLRDPNGRGLITTEDFEFSSAAELFTTTRAPGATDVSMNIGLSTAMDSTATGSITVGPRASSATTVYAAPVVARNPGLDGLSSLTRLEAINGFTQYASALQAVEGSANQQFPLLDLSLTDLYSPAQQLLSLLSEQATAKIVCGAADTSPPSGAPRPGEARYCQAVTSSFAPKAGVPVSWESPDAGVAITVPAAGAGTLGRTPTKNVKVLGGDGFPTLRVKFTGEDGVVRHARSALASIQELGRAIKRFDLDGSVSYDPTKRALEIAVRQKVPGVGQPRTVTTGGNGNLAPLTGLSGLCQAAAGLSPRRCLQTGDDEAGGSHPTPQAGDAEVTTGGASFGADFGIGLTKSTTPRVPGETVPAEPTFYLKPGTDGLLYEVGTVTAKLAKNANLVARVGFLQVDVDVSAYDLVQDGKAASVSVPTSEVPLPSEQTVQDAVTLDSLLTPDPSPATAPRVTHGLSAKATLGVRASEQKGVNSQLTRPIGATGTVKAVWKKLLADTLPTVTTEGEYDQLRLLDIVPSRQGTMGPATTGTTIDDPSADFFTQFGVTDSMTEQQRLVTRPLFDLGVPGSTSTICTQFVVVSKHSLRCTQGPLATSGKVAAGHPYVINGDPDALRDILIEDLAAVHNSFAAPGPDLGADRTFPLVDVLPAEISVARDGLGTAVRSLQKEITRTATVAEPLKPTSTMQDFSVTLDKFMAGAVSGADSATARTLEFTLLPGAAGAGGRLMLEISLQSEGTRDVPLRVATAASEVRVIASTADGKDQIATLPVKVGSQAKFVVGVDLADATSKVRADTSASEQVTAISGEVAKVRASLAGKAVDYGSARTTTGAAGNVKLGIGVGASTGVAGTADDWIKLGDFRSKLKQQRVRVGDAQTCGAPGAADAAEIAACLELPITEPGDPAPAPSMVMVALRADQSSGGAGGALAPRPIAYRFLTDALGGLNLTLADALDGDQTLAAGAPLSLPLIGTNLDAGADIPADVSRYISAARAELTSVESSVKETDQSLLLQTQLQLALDRARDKVKDRIKDDPGMGQDITASNGPVVLTCTASCLGKTVAEVQRIMVPLTLKGARTGAQQTPFQAGPAGATIVSNRTVPTKTTWTLNVTVGIARGTGPFVQLGNATAANPLLQVKVDSNLDTYKNQGSKCHSWARQDKWKAGLPSEADREIKNVDVPADKSEGAECIDAFVGKFPSVLVDRQQGGKRGTFLAATLTVDVPAPADAGPEKLVYLPSLYDKLVTFTTTATGTGALSLYFESFASKAGFFDVLGTIDLAWDNEGYSSDGLRFGLLKIDVTTLNNAILPGFDKAKKWLAPLNPVVDTLSRPIPVVSDLSELVGKGPTTLLTLLQGQGNPKIQLILNLLQLQNLIAGGPENGPDLRDIGSGFLGGFKIKPSQISRQKCTETLVDKNKVATTRTFKNADGGSGTCTPDDKKAKKEKEKGDEELPKGTSIKKSDTTTSYVSLPSVSLPVLQDTSEIFGLLLDTGDATMLYVDLGHAGISRQVVKKFGPFAVGPVPVTATIGGTAKLDGRFAFGFDTRGLSRKIELLDTGDVAGFDKMVADDAKISLFSDGFYIDDLEDGVDVPEIALTFTIQAGAAVSIGIVEAGITGGVTLDISLDAFDPNGDGKIYSDEFAGASSGPDCAFNVSSGIEFFLQFYFSIELFFYTIEESFDIYRSPRLKIFEFNCKQVDPKLAVLRDEATAPKLVLTMGPNAGERGAFAEQKQEKYTVRQLGPAYRETKAPQRTVIDLQVSAFSLVQNYVVPASTKIIADGGRGPTPSGSTRCRCSPPTPRVRQSCSSPLIPAMSPRGSLPTSRSREAPARTPSRPAMVTTPSRGTVRPRRPMTATTRSAPAPATTP